MPSQNEEIHFLSSLLYTFDLNFFLLIKKHTLIFLCSFWGGVGRREEKMKKGEEERDTEMTTNGTRF